MVRPDIIFLDAGGTLLYPEPGVGDVYAAAARRHRIEVPAAVLDAAFRDAFRERKRSALPQDREWWREVVKATFCRAGAPPLPPSGFDEVYDHFAGAAAWRLYPGAREIAPALRARGYRVGLISNWDDRLPDLLDRLRLAADLDPVVISAEVGAEKPDPRIYEVALGRAGVAPERALMVGDDPEADVAGARAAGLGAVLVWRRGGDPGVPFVRDLAGLLDLLPPRDGPAGLTG